MANVPFRSTLGPDGYRVFPQVVSAADVKETVRAVCDFTGAWPEDPLSWAGLSATDDGAVPLHHAPAFWRNRIDPRAYAVFAEVYATRRLWATMDRASFSAPGGDVAAVAPRWRVNPARPHPGRVNGLLVLMDPLGNRFQCVPSVYRELERWLRRNRADAWKAPDFAGEAIARVPARPGDLIVWDPFLPAGFARNAANRPAIYQHLSMVPVAAYADPERERRSRVRLFTERRAPEEFRDPAGRRDPEPAYPIELTELGRKLIGFESWE